MARKKPHSGKKDKTYKFEFTSLSLFLWGFFLVFLLVWIFALGILVGRGFLPGDVKAIADLKKQIVKLQGMVNRDGKGERPVLEGEETDPKLVFYEKLSSKKDEAKEKRRTRKNTDPGDTNAVQGDKPLPGPVVVERASSDGAGLDDENIPARPTSEGAQYTVQLAAVADRNTAEEMTRDLTKRGYPAYYYDVQIKGKTYYRVRCGRFKTRKQADAYAKGLARKEGMKGFVSELE